MKIQIELEKELAEYLSSFLKSSAIDNSTDTEKLNRIKQKIDKALDDSISEDVINALGKFQNIDPALIKKHHTLAGDLGIGDNKKLSLAVPLTLIADKYKDGAKVLRSECSKLSKVSDCIKLVNKKING